MKTELFWTNLLQNEDSEEYNKPGRILYNRLFPFMTASELSKVVLYLSVRSWNVIALIQRENLFLRFVTSIKQNIQ